MGPATSTIRRAATLSSRASRTIVLPEPAGPLHEVRLEFETDHRGASQNPVGPLRKAGESPADDVADPFGDAELVDGPGEYPPAVALLECPGFGEVAHHLGQEEGVPLGLLPDDPGEFVTFAAELVARRPLEEGEDGGHVEAGEREALGRLEPGDIGQQLRQRMPPADIGVAVGGDDEQPHRVLRPA